MLLKEVVNDFLTTVEIQKKNGTYRYYCSHLNYVLNYCEKREVVNVEDLANEKFYNEFVKYNKQNQVKNITINKRVKAINSLFKTKNIDCKFNSLKEQYKTFDIVPEQYLKRIINYVHNLPETSINLNFKLVIMLLCETGVRSNELLNIEKLNIDLVSNTILLTTTKIDVDRYVFFKDYTAKLIQKNLDLNSKSKYLFYNWKKNKEFDKNALTHLIRILKNKCDINNLHPHMLRHTFATLLIDNGCPLPAVQNLLGHKSLKTTERYIHQSRSKIKEEFIKFFPALIN